MTDTILIIIAIVMIANGEGGTVLWIGVGVLALIVLSALLPGKKKGSAGISEKPRTRIYHPHVIEDDDYECGICGYRFGEKVSSCPHCGVRFNCTVTDEEEYDEEEDELEDMEEEGW